MQSLPAKKREFFLCVSWEPCSAEARPGTWQEVPRPLAVLGQAHLPEAGSSQELNKKDPNTLESALFWSSGQGHRVGEGGQRGEELAGLSGPRFGFSEFLKQAEFLRVCLYLGFSTWEMRRTPQADSGF